MMAASRRLHRSVVPLLPPRENLISTTRFVRDAGLREVHRRARSGVRALVKEPFAAFRSRKLLIVGLARWDHARRRLAADDGIFGVAARAAEALASRGPVGAPLQNALQDRPALGGHSPPRSVARSRDSGGESRQYSPGIGDQNYRSPAH